MPPGRAGTKRAGADAASAWQRHVGAAAVPSRAVLPAELEVLGLVGQALSALGAGHVRSNASRAGGNQAGRCGRSFRMAAPCGSYGRAVTRGVTGRTGGARTGGTVPKRAW